MLWNLLIVLNRYQKKALRTRFAVVGFWHKCENHQFNSFMYKNHCSDFVFLGRKTRRRGWQNTYHRMVTLCGTSLSEFDSEFVGICMVVMYSQNPLKYGWIQDGSHEWVAWRKDYQYLGPLWYMVHMKDGTNYETKWCVELWVIFRKQNAFFIHMDGPVHGEELPMSGASLSRDWV